MKVSLARITSFYANAAKLSRPNPPRIPPLTNAATSFNLRRFFSSEIPKPSQSTSEQPHDADSLSNEELKREIKKLYDGDTKAFSSIFETVLKRKLSGKSDKLDEDLVKELGNVLVAQESVDSEEDDDIGVESESDKRADDTSDEEDKLC